MVVKVVERGPFGSRIKRGTIRRVEDLSDGYRVVDVEYGEGVEVLFVEPEGKGR
jgi:hypothetical protein